MRKTQAMSPAKKRNYMYLFTASHSFDAEEPLHLIAATVIHYQKCFRIKSLKEVLMQIYLLYMEFGSLSSFLFIK